MIPNELRMLITKHTRSLNHHNTLCTVFGLRISRKYIYTYYWKLLSVPFIYHESINPYTIDWCLYPYAHRDSDNAALIRSDGGMVWVQNGYKHRDFDRPAVFQSGHRFWISKDDILKHENSES